MPTATTPMPSARWLRRMSAIPAKIARLEDAGIPVVERIDEIPEAVKERLGAKV